MDMNIMLGIPAVAVILSALVYWMTPRLGEKLRSLRIVGRDVHKLKRPEVPEMGGIMILAALSVMLAFSYAATGSQSILMCLYAVAAFGIYGILDDILKLGKYQKLALSTGIAAGLVLLAGPPAALAVLLVFLTLGIGNIFNLFAGFNGLEVGCTWLISLFFSAICFLTGNIIPFYLSFGFFLVLVGFLVHNKYPARIFPGNVGTMTMGGFFAGICLYFGTYSLLIPLLFLHIADVALKAASAGYFSSSEKTPTRVNGYNILVPGDDYLSLTRLVLRLRPMTERQLVYFFWGLFSVVGFATVFATGVLL